MNEYGTMVNHQLIRHKAYHEGDKPIVYNEAPQFENGYRYSHHWEETSDSIVQIWDITEDASAVYDDDREASVEDYEAQIARFGV